MNFFRLLLAFGVVAIGTTAKGQEKPRKTLILPGISGAPAATPVAPGPVTLDLTSPEAPHQIAGGFFGLLQRGEIDRAYEELTRGSKIAERPEDLKTLKAKTREAIDVFGAISGYELVDAKNVGNRLLRRTYLSLGRDFPLRWRFYFYKSENTWRLIDLRVDDRLAGMFDEPDEPRTSLDTK